MTMPIRGNYFCYVKREPVGTARWFLVAYVAVSDEHTEAAEIEQAVQGNTQRARVLGIPRTCDEHVDD